MKRTYNKYEEDSDLPCEQMELEEEPDMQMLLPKSVHHDMNVV